MNVAGSTWVFKIKKNSDGSFQRFKSRLVVQGYNQIEELYFEYIYSPVRFATVRTVVSLAVQRNLKLHQMDRCNVFLNGDLKETVFESAKRFY